MKGNIQIESFLDKPVWQMTGKEYIGLTQYALATVSGVGGNTMSERRVQRSLGVHSLAVELGCSDSTVYSLMRTAREGGRLLRWRRSPQGCHSVHDRQEDSL